MPDPDSYELVMLINRLAALLHKNIDAKLKPHGLARTQYLVMYYLYGPGELPTGDLVTKLRVEPATLSGIVDTLEAKGLAVRTGHATDKRRKDVKLLPAGRKLIEAFTPPRAIMEDVLRQDVNPDDVNIWRAVGQQMLTNLKKELEKHDER
jgi:DNA-binding MarR family transcriptional regulator